MIEVFWPTLFFLFQKFSGLHWSGSEQCCTWAAKQGSRSSNATCPQSFSSCPQSSNHSTVKILRHCLKFDFEQNMVYLCCHTTRIDKKRQECTFCLWRRCLHCCRMLLKPFNMLTHRNLQASILPSITGILKISIETSCLLAVLQLACCTSWHAGKTTVTLSNRMQT